jgi:hypothetical protein
MELPGDQGVRTPGLESLSLRFAELLMENPELLSAVAAQSQQLRQRIASRFRAFRADIGERV